MLEPGDRKSIQVYIPFSTPVNFRKIIKAMLLLVWLRYSQINSQASCATKIHAVPQLGAARCSEASQTQDSKSGKKGSQVPTTSNSGLPFLAESSLILVPDLRTYLSIASRHYSSRSAQNHLTFEIKFFSSFSATFSSLHLNYMGLPRPGECDGGG